MHLLGYFQQPKYLFVIFMHSRLGSVGQQKHIGGKKNRKEAIDDLEKVMLFNTRESFLELKNTVVKQGV